MPPTLDDYRWLVSPDAADVLNATCESLSRESLTATATKLRKTLSAARAQLVMKQCELRARAGEKFSRGKQMFFTEVGLQQATGELVAQYKASRFPPQAVIFDLCCGIGGDLLSLAARGPAVGIERDAVIALFAAANGQLVDKSNPEVRCADVTLLEFDRTSLVHIDPDRRPAGRRTTRIELHEPSDKFLESLFTRCAGGAIKLAPASEIPESWRKRCELEWISHQGECKQLVAWFGVLAQHGIGRTATALRRNRLPATLSTGNHEFPPSPIASNIGRYLYEPDAAVIAAWLVDELATKHGLARTSPNIAYLTGNTALDDPLLAGFEIIESLPLDIKRLKQSLWVGGFGRLEVKKRGIDASPEELRRRLKVDGDNAATLILAPHAGKTLAMIARRMKVARMESTAE